MATGRITSIVARVAPNPIGRITSIAAEMGTSITAGRITYVAADVDTNFTVGRITLISADMSTTIPLPVANAGGDVTCYCGERVAILGSDSAQGTVVLRQWRLINKVPGTVEDIVLSDYTIAQPVSDTPIQFEDATYTLGYRVVDDLGLISDEDVVDINVLGADYAVPLAAGWVASGERFGTADGWV